MEKISVVVSCYNEEKALPLFYEEIERVRIQDFEGIVEFEYIFVNDGKTLLPLYVKYIKILFAIIF